jgi:hypothetical protein
MTKDKYTADLIYKHLDAVATSGVTTRRVRALLALKTDDFDLLFDKTRDFDFDPVELITRRFG